MDILALLVDNLGQKW